MTAQIIAPSWRGRVRFDDDGYVSQVGPNVRENARDLEGWAAESVADLCEELGWKYREHWHDRT